MNKDKKDSHTNLPEAQRIVLTGDSKVKYIHTNLPEAQKIVLTGDSQVKYIKSENLNTPECNVSVRSVSGLKVEQGQERFSHKLA